MTQYTLHLGDCLDYMRTMDAGSVDAVITDPPYGIGDKMKGGTWAAKDHNLGFQKWDLQTNQEWIDAIIALEKNCIIWGGNYYKVPPSRCWLIWSKLNAVPTMADFEMAWTNIDKPANLISLPVGRVNFGHPTEKPLTLMRWCIENYTQPGDTVFDPFMGSGTTGVACMQLGRNFIGCEIDPTYYAIAERRIRDAAAQPALFTLDAPQVKPTQDRLIS